MITRPFQCIERVLRLVRLDPLEDHSSFRCGQCSQPTPFALAPLLHVFLKPMANRSILVIPEKLKIENIERPDWGEPSEFVDGEIPVFWACGVTLQSAIQSARPPICITHAPGSMLITDIPNWRQVGSIRDI